MRTTTLLAVAFSLLSVTHAIPRNSRFSELIPRATAGTAGRCVVQSHNDPKADDVPAIMEAFEKCGDQGTIVFEKGVTYYVWSLLRMSNCHECVVEWDGVLQLGDDIDVLGTKQLFFTPFQGKSTLIIFEHAYKAHVYSPSGTGRLEGNGQLWWERNANAMRYSCLASDLDPGTLRRPVLIVFDNCHHMYLDRLFLNESPNWNSIIKDSSWVTMDNFKIVARAVNSTIKPKNTDGMDTMNSTNIWVNNLHFDGGDDCVAWKGNNTNVGISNSVCIGSHGTSIGSLAQYAGVHDYVKGVEVRNVTFNGARSNNALRIKVWPASPIHGSAYVEDVLFTDITVENVDTPIFVESCYESTTEECVAYPSKSTVKNIVFRNVKGTTSGAKKSVVADLRCPPSANCSISLENIDITPGGDYSNTTATYLCQGLSTDPGVPCTDSSTADGGYVAGRV